MREMKREIGKRKKRERRGKEKKEREIGKREERERRNRGGRNKKEIVIFLFLPGKKMEILRGVKISKP